MADTVLDELKDAASESIKQRLSNTLFVSFIISWFVVNWKVFFIAFASNIDFNSKMHLIYQAITIDKHMFVYPIGGALFYSFVIPLLSIIYSAARGLFEVWQSKLYAFVIKNKKHSDADYTIVAARNLELLTEMQEAAAKYNRELADKMQTAKLAMEGIERVNAGKEKIAESQIALLKNELNTTKNQNGTYAKQIEILNYIKATISPEWLALSPARQRAIVRNDFKKMKHLNNPMSIHDALTDMMNQSPEHIEELRENGYVLRVFDHFLLTPKGITLLAADNEWLTNNGWNE